MTFTSPAFFAFTLAVLLACAAAGPARRWVVLLAASYAFYASWSPVALPALLAATTLGTWASARRLERETDERRRSLLVWAGVVAALGPLVAVRIAASLAPGLGGGSTLSAAAGSAVVTVGVSYWSLQAIGYVLDVRDGVVPAEPHLGRHALSLAFFPKLVQGPIQRAEALLPQLAAPRPLAPGDVAAGAQRVLWGMFQKVVVADRLAPFVDAAYRDVGHQRGLALLVATYAFAAQLYFDFAGYTDVALGIARCFGIRLTPNFASPYLARSLAEFWRRWHISLSSWLQDYVFRPVQLELRDRRTFGTPIAVLATFLVSGVWHGWTWGFVAWGLLHGAFIAASILAGPRARKLHAALGLSGTRALAIVQVIVTFHLVCLAWVFFRAASLRDALRTLAIVATDLPASVRALLGGGDAGALLYLGQGRGAFLAAVAAVVVATALRRLEPGADAPAAPERAPRPAWWPFVRTAVGAVMLYGIVVLGTSAQGFLYSRF
jgi:D-alanyl-lipoteichoic acid acyltransferase DltB (MBOAT superfamily)